MMQILSVNVGLPSEVAGKAGASSPEFRRLS